MAQNGNGHNGSGNGLLNAKSVQELLAEFESTGRQEPFEEIVRRYAGMVFNVCYGVTKDTHEAEDATQAVFLTLAVRSKTSQKIQYLGPWLQRVAQRLSLDMKRSKKRRSAREIKHHHLNVSRWSDNAQPADLSMDELRGILRDEIDRLPAKYRMPLILHYFGGLKPEELSKELGIKANTLGVRLHRARKMLADSLQRRGIVVGGAMLSAALASLVPMYVQHTIASHAVMQAARWSAAHGLIAADVTTTALAAMGGMNRSMLLGRIKAVTAAIALGAAAMAGGAQLLHSFKPFGWNVPSPFDLKHVLSPLLERLRTPLRFSQAPGTPLPAPLETEPRPSAGGIASGVAGDPDWPKSAFDVEGHCPSASWLASIGGTPAQVASIERTRIAPPIRFGSGLAAMNQPHRPVQPAPIPAMPVTAHRGSAVLVSPAPALIPVQTVHQQFEAARGHFAMSHGLLQTPTIRLDSKSALRDFRIDGGMIRTQRLVVADTGLASFKQTGGEVLAGELVVAQAPRSVGSLEITGGALVADRQDIGMGGVGSMTHLGGSNTARAVALGTELTGQGAYRISAGTLHTTDLTIGVAGRGTFTAAGGVTRVDSARSNGGLVLALGQTSHGTLAQVDGLIESRNVLVGFNGTANWDMSGGLARASNIVVGAADSSRATVNAVNGTIVLDRATLLQRGGRSISSRVADLTFDRSPGALWSAIAANSLDNLLVVGSSGSARVQLGDRESSARVIEGSADSTTPVIVRASPSGEGVISGHGDVALRGLLIMNGKTIADGFGLPRHLDLSSLAGVFNSIDNASDGDYGWYAQRGGQVTLPPIRVESAGFYNWGETEGDDSPDLVNSVRLGFSNVRKPGDVLVSLIAAELLPGEKPLDQKFIGAWRVSRSDLLADSTDLLIRYDAKAVERMGLPESDLTLWAFDGQWRQLDESALRLNIDQNLIGGTLTGDFTYFGLALTMPGLADDPQAFFQMFASSGTGGLAPDVAPALADFAARGSFSGVPEPSTIGALAAAGLLLARRRR